MNRLSLSLSIPLISLILLISPTSANQKTKLEQQFQTWLIKDLWPEAKAKGITKKTFNKALKGITLNWRLPGISPSSSTKKNTRKQSQAEFRSPARYFNQNNINQLVQTGRKHLKTWSKIIRSLEKRYGVPGPILVAIWGRESAFGKAPLPHNAIRVLATRAFIGERKTLFQAELLAALKITQDGHISRKAMKSSWAGALGQPQFMPSKFLSHAIDFDGDKRPDIWNSVPDSLASIAYYLHSHGWQKGRDWGFEAIIPHTISCALGGPEQGRAIKAWITDGVIRTRNRVFPKNERKKIGYLLMPAGRYGPSFIVTPNFYALKHYNESDLYALFIGHLADRLANNRPFVQSWKKLTGLTRHDIKHMQKQLIAKGYDVGGADGLIGFKTRTAIGLWQQKHGLKPTCFPNAKLIKAMR